MTGFWYEIDLYSNRLLNEFPSLQSNLHTSRVTLAFQGALVVKKSPANTGDIRDVGLSPGLGRSPGGGYSNPVQYSCLDNPMDRGAWRGTVHGFTKSRTQLND